MTKAESKYFNTAKKMDEALLTLLDKKDFGFITIKDICQAAGVNRSTFYLHYENIDDLLKETIDYIMQTFFSYFDDKNEKISFGNDEKFSEKAKGTARTNLVLKKIEDGRTDELNFMKKEFLVPYLTFIKENQKIFLATLKLSVTLDQESAFRDLKKYILYPVLNCFEVPDEKQKYYLAFFFYGVVAIIKEWILDGCRDDIDFVCDILMSCTKENR